MKILLLFGAILCYASAFAQNSDFIVTNNSYWTIDQMYLSPTSNDAWGDDQLESEIIPSYSKYELKAVPCDVYDIKFLDEDGDECILVGVEICNDHPVEITNKNIAKCNSQ